MSQQCSWPTHSWPLEGRCPCYALLGLSQAPGSAGGHDFSGRLFLFPLCQNHENRCGSADNDNTQKNPEPKESGSFLRGRRQGPFLPAEPRILPVPPSSPPPGWVNEDSLLLYGKIVKKGVVGRSGPGRGGAAGKYGAAPMVSSTVRLVSWAAEVVIRTRFPSTVSCAAAEKRKAAAIPKAASRAIHFLHFIGRFPSFPGVCEAFSSL